MAGLTDIAELEALAEDPLLEDPVLKLRPLAEPLLVVWVGRVGQVHSFRSDEAVERCSYVEEQFAL